VKDKVNFDDIEKIELHDQRIEKNLTNSIKIDISIIQLDCETSDLYISSAQSYHVFYEIAKAEATISIRNCFVRSLNHQHLVSKMSIDVLHLVHELINCNQIDSILSD
jgi:hypothetical protein